MRPSENTTDGQDRIDAFIARWAGSGGAERANFQGFAYKLCDLIGVDRPEAAGSDPAMPDRECSARPTAGALHGAPGPVPRR